VEFGGKREDDTVPQSRALEELAAKLELDRLNDEYGPADSVQSRVNMHQHELLITQITLNDAQFQALKEQKKYSRAVARATWLMLIVTFFIAWGTIWQSCFKNSGKLQHTKEYCLPPQRPKP